MFYEGNGKIQGHLQIKSNKLEPTEHDIQIDNIKKAVKELRNNKTP